MKDQKKEDTQKHKKRWADMEDEDLSSIDLEINLMELEEEMSSWLQYFEDPDQAERAYDDVKGGELDLKKVRDARALEMRYVKDRKVYKYANVQDAYALGKRVIGVRWVDTTAVSWWGSHRRCTGLIM